jgi:NTP pyrophosphatase (non-canonical NTP hydrolase)
VGSVRFEGVRFFAYPQDHEPAHVHGFYAEVEVILELREAVREVALADRNDAIRPGNASRSDVKHILQVAADHFDALIQLWREARG